MGCEAQLLENAYSLPLFRGAILTRKVGQTDLVFGVQSGFISRSVCAAVTICTNVVNIQTRTHIHRQAAF